MLITWASFTVGLWATSRLLPGFEISGGLRGSFVVAGIFGLLNWAVGWLLFTMIGILTLGLGFLLAVVTHWVVNLVLLVITDALSQRFKIHGFRTAALGALGVSFFGSGADWVLTLLTA